LEPGLHEFVASCHERGAKWEAKSFNIEANVTYYFHVHHRLAEFHKPLMRISELTEIEGNDLISLKDKYEYVQPDGSK
jgi:hypothetical protein